MSKQPTDDQPAFPTETLSYQGVHYGWEKRVTPGMTLRDYFAAAALSNMATMIGETFVTDPDCAARAAHAYADAMLANRK